MSVNLTNSHEFVYSVYSDDEDYADLIQLFYSSMPEKIDQMRAAFSSNNLTQLQTYAHQLKGSGAGYGFPELSSLASELEVVCKQHDLLKITSQLETIISYMSRITC